MPTTTAEATTPALDALAAVVAAKPGAQARTGQQQMAAAVEKTLAEGGTLQVEAGCGVGKSFGYLVPAVLHAVRRRADRAHQNDQGGSGGDPGMTRKQSSAVIVATATKALQEQLVEKDLPFLADALADHGVEFEFAMLKGRSNYLCRARWEEKLGDVGVGADVLTDSSERVLLAAPEVADLREWVATTDTGERSELEAATTVPDTAWRELSVTSEECPGKKSCPFGEDCFVYSARARAADADIVVANTALYGAHLASGGRALPEHEAVIFDEAHTLENVMAEALSVTVGPQRLRNLAYKVRRVVADSEAFELLIKAAEAYTWVLAPEVGMRVDPTSGDLGDVLCRAVDAVQIAVDEIGVVSDGADPASGGAAAKKARAQQAQVATLAEGLLEELTSLVAGSGESGGSVSWVEDNGGGPRLRRAPVDVGPKLARDLFGTTTVVATSATLRVGGSFTPVARRWGLLLPGSDGEPPVVESAVVDSPFTYRSQGYLYVAGHLPDPRGEQWAPLMHAELARLATAAGGRTLALFTSRTGMTAAAEYLRANTALNVLAQGDAGRTQLLEEFTAASGSVLCALASFWTGVDIAGPALSLVTIDKIPFPRRGEPLMDARRQAANRAGGNGFADVDVPLAATDLAQGAGRLIRAVDDRGVVALFDSRLIRKAYGRTLLDSLPPLYPTTDPALVEAALARLVAGLEDTPSAVSP